jgi:hypothetical protein
VQQESFNICEILSNYNLNGEYQGFFPSNNGHINNTFVLEFRGEDGRVVNYILQQINTSVFRNPDQLMQNIVTVSEHLRNTIIRNGGNPDRENLNVIFTGDNKPYLLDEKGRYWRCYNYISDSYCCQRIDRPEVFYNAAKAFGKFQCMLADFPIDTLHETIPNFHNTISRFEDLKMAVEADIAGRAAMVRDEINFAFEREADTGVLLQLAECGMLPLRVTHNDTKLNNVMFDKDSNEGICVIDLDTVMPGLSLYDFGDSIRYGASTAAEDEEDVSKVSLDLELFEHYVNGYLTAAGKSLTPCEVEYLPFSAKLLTLECGIRFLTDYLNGDTYFRTAYPDHNLVRCRTQFALVADIERKMGRMNEITSTIFRGL